MKIAVFSFAGALVLGAAYFLLRPAETVVIQPPGGAATSSAPSAAAAEAPSFTAVPLADPPAMIYGEYFTAWSGGSAKRMDDFALHAAPQGLDAAVIDLKDYSGYVSYAMPDVPAVAAAGADKDLRIRNIDAVVNRLHSQGIYVIGRVTVFQDPIFAKAHPELALKDKTTGGLWRDNHGLAWLDPAGEPTWDYVVGIARDAYAHGFDEVNFDYIRFPSDGNLQNAAYPFWDEKTPRHLVLRKFFAYLRQALPDKKISADLFGLVTVAEDDMGIGQVLEDALPYFDYVCPMVYPSHYASGFQGYVNPAEAPYQVINYSLSTALLRREKLQRKLRAEAEAATATTTAATTTAAAASPPVLAKFRPWLQVFNLGAVYTPAMVQKEIQATADAFASSSAATDGWLLWDPANNYRSFTGRVE